MNERSKTIAIIGAGASGTACFLQLVLKYIVRQVKQPLSIHIFEKRNEFGEGLAFGTGQEGHLLNTKAGLMGIFPYERMHFVQWMHQNQEMIAKEFPQVSIHPDAYPPRMLFGRYVQAMFNQYCEIAKEHGVDVQLVQDEVVDATIHRDNRVSLKTGSGRTHKANYAILATGNPASNTFQKLAKQKRFFPSPWPSSRILSEITDKTARVSIVGSSLTAIDALITLIGNGHEGPISFFSLKGLLPRVQSPTEIPYIRKVLTLANVRKHVREKQKSLRLTDLIRMFRSEAESYREEPLDWAAEEREDKDQLTLLEEDIALAAGKQCLLQNILYSLREETYDMWKLLPADQKLLFLKWMKPYFDINRHAMPMENALKIREVLRSGQLTIIGNTNDIEWKENRFVLTTEKGESSEADYVINASGPAAIVEKIIDQPLLPRLLKKKYIEEYAAGGIHADLDTLRVVTSSRKRPSPFYVIGHQLAGLQLDINAFWFNVEQSDLLSESLLKNI
ncbi:FAD/NAD(P)-binding protein [Sphingobacterium deserti]|uniref:FAD-dependent urate hydroxylase HpyO/Asp monooxygenase CreE-like FAD/NAD(P)-binding domain-containing protein n=1 Tax=Sphingobacterium deserti TaxID=1229276 RepID=A0A0B8T6P8_9SPHI|nr:FAD/NAD(P)-binding protein [Sphingobacterium deserti]KGE13060.1 hypothetical protein DI53_3277 [Sphingobacterium deserti]